EIAADHLAFVQRRIESPPDQSPTDRLTCFFTAGFAFIESFPARGRLIVNAVYGPVAEYRARVYQAYEPMFTLIARDILEVGIARGDFQAVNTDVITALIMSIYLGACSQFDSSGKIWLDPQKVVRFILDGLRGCHTA
ncbi:MAG TPA: hypothetical protein VMT34_12975, partial [Aggregatilineales bacterium]|nr:hypothetical protein [Aggregatilineales bacterium]